MKDYRDFSEDLVRRALRRGADGADAYLVQLRKCAIDARMGTVETLQESSSEGVGLRVFRKGATALVHSTDLSRASLDRLLDEAMRLAAITDSDPGNCLPDARLLAPYAAPLAIHDDLLHSFPIEEKTAQLHEMEAAGRAVDGRINNSNGAWWRDSVERVTLANSAGFVGQYDHTQVGMGVSLVAEQNGVKQTDSWSSSARSLGRLEPAEVIGRKAASRVLRKLGGRPVSTQAVPIVFDPIVGEDLLRILFEALNGMAILRHNSFMVGRLGERVGNPLIHLVDDATMVAGLGSRPFDGEGVGARRTDVIRGGILSSYLCDTFTAIKLGLDCTGNAARRFDAAPVVGPTNLYLEAGTTPPEEIIRSVSRGMFVTKLYWVGTNLANGDYSRGAEGVWIENGELTHPIQEVTIAGNVLDMLQRIAVVGSDLEFRGPLASPTLLVSDIVISGR